MAAQVKSRHSLFLSRLLLAPKVAEILAKSRESKKSGIFRSKNFPGDFFVCAAQRRREPTKTVFQLIIFLFYMFSLFILLLALFSAAFKKQA